MGISQEPNLTVPAEVIFMAVHPHGTNSAANWITPSNRHPDILAIYDSVGDAPDKQWITIDTQKTLPDDLVEVLTSRNCGNFKNRQNGTPTGQAGSL
jgi:hypothetical protein